MIINSLHYYLSSKYKTLIPLSINAKENLNVIGLR